MVQFIDFASYGEKVTMRFDQDDILLVNILNPMDKVEEQACNLIADLASTGRTLEVPIISDFLYNIVLYDRFKRRISLWFKFM